MTTTLQKMGSTEEEEEKKQQKRTGKTGQGGRSGSQGGSESTHFSATARYQGAHGIGSQSQAFAHASRQCNHVLNGTANFDSYHIPRREDSEALIR